MNANDYNGEPGACAWDRDREELGEADQRGRCAHPDHWRRPARGVVEDGSCRLCGASAATIAKERAAALADVKGAYVSVDTFHDELVKRR